MKHHKYYKERITSFLTAFELNPSSISQRWIENKFYSLDEERISNFRQRFKRENAHVSSIRQIRNPTSGQKKSSSKNIRYKYCYRLGHEDTECRQKQSKRPPSMPDWVSKVICSKCKKKGHLAFNCPPKYDNKCIRSKSRPKIQSTNNESVAYTSTEFAGAATHFVPNNQYQNHISIYPHQHKIPGSHHKSSKIQNRTRYSFSQTK